MMMSRFVECVINVVTKFLNSFVSGIATFVFDACPYLSVCETCIVPRTGSVAIIRPYSGTI